ncbi:hypothetical protein EPUL_004261, partial [Erysiphe pulchra]
MGSVSSRYDEASVLYLRDQNRLTISSLLITNARHKTVLHVVPNTFPATKYSGSREGLDTNLLEYVQYIISLQDPEPSSNPSNFILKLNKEDELNFKFSFIIRQVHAQDSTSQQDTNINGLTYVSASTAKEVETLVTREFHADPNLHKNANVQLVGDYSTNSNQSVTFDWSWKWRPPKSVEDRGGGWRNTCSPVVCGIRPASASIKYPGKLLFLGLNQPDSPCGKLGLTSNSNSRASLSQHVGSRRVSEAETRNLDDPPSPKTTVAEDCLAPAALSKDMSETEDGPLFRATMKALEQKTGSMRQRMKKLLKKAEAAHVALTESNDAISAFMEALREASFSNSNAVQPALEHYFDKIAREILKYERQSSINLQKIIIEPIMKVYNIDIKQAEFKKRDFEEESKDYYAYVSRYLGQRQDSLKEKKRADSDSKYQIKRRNFELKRFDYSSFMQDLHGGRKEQEVLSHLTKYAEAQTRGYLATAEKIEDMLPQLDALSAKVQEAEKEFQYQRTEREEKRRNLEKSNPMYTEPDILLPIGSIPVPALLATSPVSNPIPDSELSRSDSTASQLKLAHSGGILSSNINNGSNYDHLRSPGAPNSYISPVGGNSSNQNKFKGIRDLEEKDRSQTAEKNGAQRKEGLLWALSRPGSHSDPRGLNKQAWHKFWTVVDAGKVSEYSNWKQRLDLHREPINLRVASVREARNAERRFCFEVITPQYKRVYQATSEEDMNSWISAINNAIQSAVEGRDVRDVPAPISRQESHSKRRDIGSILTGKSSSNSHGPHQNISNGISQTTNTSVFRRTTVGARPVYSRGDSSGFDESPDKLLQLLRDADQGNHWCADCNSGVKTEWVSINLGIILCIECSGIHRSLGTHISKVRSLTLDLQSFTTDIVELLLLVGNRLSNMVWEAKLEQGIKPSPHASREARLRFITAKYVDRMYLQPISPKLSRYNTADETLLAGVKRNDIQQVIYALALRASPNVCDKSRGTHCVFLALAAADPALPSSVVTSPVPRSKPDKVIAFPIAEILIQNGAEIPATLPAFPLSQSACLYIEQKSGRKSLLNDTVGSSQSPNISTGSKQQKEREIRLHKRVSAGGRLAKVSIPEKGMKGVLKFTR